jgi:hypothetical protein
MHQPERSLPGTRCGARSDLWYALRSVTFVRLLVGCGSDRFAPCAVDPLPLSAQERGEVEGENVAELLREAPQPESPAPYGHFFVGTDDHLWVQRDRPFGVGADPYAVIHGNAGGRFDVFDPLGRYLGELRAPDGVRLRAAAGDRVWGIHSGEAEDPRIVAFRLGPR